MSQRLLKRLSIAMAVAHGAAVEYALLDALIAVAVIAAVVVKVAVLAVAVVLVPILAAACVGKLSCKFSIFPSQGILR